ncbi:hypothetical protein T484DRAFT_1945451 [Baffinella frigidus]|nr:hypothetical protein T484DRAFT_1945451 [Cryptophyta sp. CCMP2293]
MNFRTRKENSRALTENSRTRAENPRRSASSLPTPLCLSACRPTWQPASLPHARH